MRNKDEILSSRVFNSLHFLFVLCIGKHTKYLTFQSTKSNAIKHLGLLCLAPEIIDRPTGPQPETTTMSLILMPALSTPWSPQDKGWYRLEKETFLRWSYLFVTRWRSTFGRLLLKLGQKIKWTFRPHILLNKVWDRK